MLGGLGGHDNEPVLSVGTESLFPQLAFCSGYAVAEPPAVVRRWPSLARSCGHRDRHRRDAGCRAGEVTA